MGGDSALDRSDGATPRPFFNPWVTVLWALLVALLLGLFVAAYLHGRPLEGLAWPEASLERLVAREMDLRAALREAPRWERRLYYALFSPDAEALQLAIVWYEELVASSESSTAELDRLVLLGEAGRTEPVAAGLATREPDAPAWVRAAYLEAPADPDARAALLAQIRGAEPAHWFTDVLRARVAARLGDVRTRTAAESAIAARGRALLGRWRVLVAAEVLVLALAAAVGLRWRRRPGPAIGEAPLPPPWTLADGTGLCLRGAGAYLAVVTATAALTPSWLGPEGWGLLVAGLPAWWWTARYLRSRDAPLLATFGLRVLPGRAARLAGATVVLVGLAVLGDLAIGAGTGGLHVRTHWTDGFQEVTLWGQPWWVAADAADAVVWAPLVEEVGFRGILYATLRVTMAPWPAAALSAGAFALLHGYGLAGLASVLWSGLLWALAYERTGSLLPGMLAHGTANLVTTLTFLWLVRL